MRKNTRRTKKKINGDRNNLAVELLPLIEVLCRCCRFASDLNTCKKSFGYIDEVIASDTFLQLH